VKTFALAALEESCAEYVAARDEYVYRKMAHDVALAKLEAVRRIVDQLPPEEREELERQHAPKGRP
jgi:hypothetical protein